MKNTKKYKGETIMWKKWSNNRELSPISPKNIKEKQ